jgi:hypothetical protein
LTRRVAESTRNKEVAQMITTVLKELLGLGFFTYDYVVLHVGLIVLQVGFDRDDQLWEDQAEAYLRRWLCIKFGTQGIPRRVTFTDKTIFACFQKYHYITCRINRYMIMTIDLIKR